jgi:hypothetical protein
MHWWIVPPSRTGRHGHLLHDKPIDYSAKKLTSSKWHIRSGHPAFPIVHRVIRDNDLPFISDKDSQSVCGSCQMAKSHQLSYPISNKLGL